MPKPFDILRELGRFGLDRRLSLRDPGAKPAFALHVSEAVDRALSDPALLQGQRVEAMFESLLLSLGKFRLLKAEDAGRVFPAGEFIAPDFRVVLDDGDQWLIEVKNVYEPAPFEQRRQLMDQNYYAKLAAYAAATGADLKLAVFWARWSMWTLVSPGRLLDERGSLTLDMMTAAKVNELGRLGDMTIGTRAPLRLRLVMDPDQASPIGPDGEVQVVIGGSALYCEDREIVDATDREIAWVLMQHGEWRETGPQPIIDGDRLLALEFAWEPQEPSDQGFEFIGSLSRMFARFYAQHTVKDQQVIQLQAPLRPGWFLPLMRTDHHSSALPLWRLIIQPNYEATSDGAPPGDRT